MNKITEWLTFLTETAKNFINVLKKGWFHILLIQKKASKIALKLVIKSWLLAIIIFLQKYYVIIISNIICIFFIFFIFYNRLFRLRTPKSIDEVSFLFIFIGICIIIVNIVILTIYIQQYKDKTNKNKKNAKSPGFRLLKERFFFIFLIIPQIFSIVLQHFLETYKKFLRKVINYSFFHLNFFLPPTLFLINNLSSYTKSIYYLVFILPRLFVTLVFFIEVIFFKEIKLFYKLLWILLIPLIGKIIRFTYKELAYILVSQYDDYFYVGSIETIIENSPFIEQEIKTFCWHNEILKKKYGRDGEKHHLDGFKYFTKIYYFWDYFYRLAENKITIILNIILSCLLIIVWSYIIINYFIMFPENFIYFFDAFYILLLLGTLFLCLSFFIIFVKQDVTSCFTKIIKKLRH